MKEFITEFTEVVRSRREFDELYDASISDLLDQPKIAARTREMLVLAAKAAGAVWAKNLNTWLIWKGPEDPDEGGAWCEWSPLTDDGDCASMEAALGISKNWFIKPGYVECFNDSEGMASESFIDHGGDRNAARRLASLRVAAAIGKAMP